MQGVSAHVCGYYESPIGLLLVRGSGRGIFSVLFVEEEREDAGLHEILQPCMDQLHAYFSGAQHNFHSLPLTIQSTDFQLQVWEYLITIPYGKTRTYSTCTVQYWYSIIIIARLLTNGYCPSCVVFFTSRN